MDLQFYGGNCVSLSNKQVRIVVDDNLADLGAKSVIKEGDICLFTGAHATPTGNPKIVIDQPGEYEVSGVSVSGLQARAHIDEVGQRNATVFKLTIDDIRIVVTGHIFPELSENELEELGVVDVLIIPVGGNGYTLDGVGALNIIKEIEPKLIIPTHYADKGLHFAVPQQTLEDALKAISMEPKEKTPKLRLKPGDLADIAQLVVLERS